MLIGVGITSVVEINAHGGQVTLSWLSSLEDTIELVVKVSLVGLSWVKTSLSSCLFRCSVHTTILWKFDICISGKAREFLSSSKLPLENFSIFIVFWEFILPSLNVFIDERRRLWNSVHRFLILLLLFSILVSSLPCRAHCVLIFVAYSQGVYEGQIYELIFGLPEK